MIISNLSLTLFIYLIFISYINNKYCAMIDQSKFLFYIKFFKN